MKLKTTAIRGVIQPRTAPRPFDVARWQAPDGLADYIEHVWRVRWHISQPIVQFTLPDPVVHVVFEADEAYVQGPMSTRFQRELEGEGEVLGFKFRPGAFRSLSDTPIRALLDRRIPVNEFFGPDATRLAQDLFSVPEPDRIARVAQWLRTLLSAPPPPEQAQITTLVERMVADRTIHRVSAVCDALGVSERTLQRHFQDVVGWTPRQVIRRRRMHDALLRLDEAVPPDFASLAYELGYCDQAHFSRDFKRMVGMTVRTYVGSGQTTR